MAGVPKTSLAFSIPMTSAASDTSRMNGNMIRVSVTVSAALAGSNQGAITATIHGAHAIPMMTMPLSTITARVATLFASAQAARSPCAAVVLLNTVMNAVDRAPSAKRSRSRFGMRKAMVNASMMRPPPKRAAKTCSRTTPSTRLQSTARATMVAARVFSFSWRGAAAAALAPAAGISAWGMRAPRYHIEPPTSHRGREAGSGGLGRRRQSPSCRPPAAHAHDGRLRATSMATDSESFQGRGRAYLCAILPKACARPRTTRSAFAPTQQREKEEPAGHHDDEWATRPVHEQCDIGSHRCRGDGGDHRDRQHRPEAARKTPGNRRGDDDERAHEQYSEEPQSQPDGEREGEEKTKIEARHID